MTEQKKADINSMTSRQLKIEIERLNQCLEMRDIEIGRLKALIENMAAIEADKEDALDMKRKANQALNSAFEQADAIIMQARQVADKIINRAKEISNADDKAEFTLPGSKELVISDDLLKAGGAGGNSLVNSGEFNIINGNSGMSDENKRSWMNILDKLHQ